MGLKWLGYAADQVIKLATSTALTVFKLEFCIPLHSGNIIGKYRARKLPRTNLRKDFL
jgi:hypothetical protein